MVNNRKAVAVAGLLLLLILVTVFALPTQQPSSPESVELDLTGSCDNPPLQADNRYWTTASTISPQWNDLESVTGQFEWDGNDGTFTSDDQWTMTYRHFDGFQDLVCIG